MLENIQLTAIVLSVFFFVLSLDVYQHRLSKTISDLLLVGLTYSSTAAALTTILRIWQ